MSILVILSIHIYIERNMSSCLRRHSGAPFHSIFPILRSKNWPNEYPEISVGAHWPWVRQVVWIWWWSSCWSCILAETRICGGRSRRESGRLALFLTIWKKKGKFRLYSLSILSCLGGWWKGNMLDIPLPILLFLFSKSGVICEFFFLGGTVKDDFPSHQCCWVMICRTRRSTWLSSPRCCPLGTLRCSRKCASHGKPTPFFFWVVIPCASVWWSRMSSIQVNISFATEPFLF